MKPKEGQKPSDDEVIAYLDGTEGCLPCLTLRLNDLKAGEYYVLYRPDFKDYHKVRRLNIVFYSEFMQKKSAEEIREWDKEAAEAAKNNIVRDSKLAPAASAAILSPDEGKIILGNLDED